MEYTILKNIKLDNFNIQDSNNLFGNLGIITASMNNSSSITNTFVNNSKIQSTKPVAAIVGTISDGTLKDIHIKNED